MSEESRISFHDFGLNLTPDLASDPSFDARRTAVVVIDLQNGIAGFPAAPANALSARQI